MVYSSAHLTRFSNHWKPTALDVLSFSNPWKNDFAHNDFANICSLPHK